MFEGQRLDNHCNLYQQVAALELRDDTQKGHILGQAAANARSLRERDLDGLSVAATRFVLHSAMLAGSVYHAGGAITVHDHIFPKLRSENEVRHQVLGHSTVLLSYCDNR